LSKHHSGNQANPDETWVRGAYTANPRVVRKATVRIAKGLPGAGQFNGATNYRGTERPENRLSRLR
jgi:hypothetical protein